MLRGRVLRGAAIADAGVAPANIAVVSARPARGIVVSGELVESARQDGYQAGHDEGYQAGYAQGMNDARHHAQLLGELVERLGREADALAAREATARADIEDQVVTTAFQIAEVLVGHEIAAVDQRGRDAIARALALAPARGHVRARLHPVDLGVIPDPDSVDEGRTLEIVADPTLNPGDAVIDVGACRVDARLAPALERIREVLS